MTTLNTFGSQASRDKAKEIAKLRMEQGLSAYKTPIERAIDKPDSLRCAITAKCYECVGMDGDSNYRETIRTCTSKKCPLYVVRPYQKNHEVKDDKNTGSFGKSGTASNCEMVESTSYIA